MYEKIKYDMTTSEWFKKHPLQETTVTECKKCGLYYKPSLGHKCKSEPKEQVIKPCPFCGSKEITVQKERSFYNAWCLKCFASIAGFETKDAAIKSWNTRCDL